MEDKLKREGERCAEFSQRLGTATASLDNARKKLAGKPGQDAVDGMSEQLTEIQLHLTEANSLARTKEDRAATASAETDYARVREEWQQRLDQAFLQQYEDFDKRLTEIERH